MHSACVGIIIIVSNQLHQTQRHKGTETKRERGWCIVLCMHSTSETRLEHFQGLETKWFSSKVDHNPHPLATAGTTTPLSLTDAANPHVVGELNHSSRFNDTLPVHSSSWTNSGKQTATAPIHTLTHIHTHTYTLPKQEFTKPCTSQQGTNGDVVPSCDDWVGAGDIWTQISTNYTNYTLCRCRNCRNTFCRCRRHLPSGSFLHLIILHPPHHNYRDTSLQQAVSHRHESTPFGEVQEKDVKEEKYPLPSPFLLNSHTRMSLQGGRETRIRAHI